MTQAIFWLRCLSMAVQAACLVALVRRRLARRYPVFWAFVLFGLLHSAWALHRGHPAGYEEAAALRWTLAALYGAAAIEACVAQARHFRSLFSVAIGAIVVFAVLSAAVVGAICLFGADILLDGGPAMLTCGACCLLLVLSAAFFSTFPVAMRANVRWHVLILLILLAGEAVETGLGFAGPPGASLAAQFLGAGCSLACYVLWTVKMVPSGECFLPLSEIPAEVLARLVAREPLPAEGFRPPRRAPAGAGGSTAKRQTGGLRRKADLTV